jgi:hypothetical protein
MAKQLTKEEVKQNFLSAMEQNIDYWANLPMAHDETLRDRLEGCIFGALVVIDGEHADIPGFILAPNPHPSDKSYCRKNGRNWYPENHKSNIKCDIGGALHHSLRTHKKKKESD